MLWVLYHRSERELTRRTDTHPSRPLPCRCHANYAEKATAAGYDSGRDRLHISSWSGRNAPLEPSLEGYYRPLEFQTQTRLTAQNVSRRGGGGVGTGPLPEILHICPAKARASRPTRSSSKKTSMAAENSPSQVPSSPPTGPVCAPKGSTG